MAERRATLRHRILKSGIIAFNRAGGISCLIRNVSPTGACLEVASQAGVPDRFTLVIESEHWQRPCRVAWRKNNRLGVAFDAPEAA